MTEIDRELANNVLNYFRGGEGYSGGGFFISLMQSFAKADVTNQAKLALGYPAHAEAYTLVTTDSVGLHALRAIARGEAPATLPPMLSILQMGDTFYVDGIWVSDVTAATTFSPEALADLFASGSVNEADVIQLDYTLVMF